MSTPTLSPANVFVTPVRKAQGAMPASAGSNGAGRPKETAAITVRPTLLIGVGGSGHRIALCLKRAYGDNMPEHVKILVLDSAHEDLRIKKNGQEWRLEPGNELIYIGDVSVAAIMRNQDRLSVLRETFAESLQRLPRVTYRDGVAGNRTAGRLTFHYHESAVERTLAAQLRELARHEGAASETLAQSSGLNIAIFGSACGGQGSGAITDLGYLLRELLAELGQLADNSRITGLFLLPDAFPGVSNPYLEANTVEFLQGLEGWMAAGGFQTRFPNRREVLSQEAPFDRVFLIGGVDQKGRTRRSHAEVCATAGQLLYLLFASAAGQKLENDLFNHSDVLGQRTETGELTCFGTLGLAAMAADGARLQNACARRLAADVIGSALLSAPAQAGASQSAIDFVGRMGLEPEALKRTLLQDPDGGQLMVDLALPGHIARRPPEEAPAAAANYVRDYRQGRLLRQVVPQIDANTTGLGDRVVAEVGVTLASLVRAGGVRQAAAAAAAMRQRVAAQLATWQQSRESWVQRHTQSEEALVQAEEVLNRTAGQIFLLRRAAVSQALPRFERAAQAWAEAFVNRRVAEAACTTLAAVERVARRGEDQYLAIAQRLQQTLPILEIDDRKEDGEETGALAPDIDLLDASLQDQFYSAQAPSPAAGMADALSAAAAAGWPVETWDQMTPGQLADLLAASLRGPFSRLAELGVEEVVTAQQAEISAELRLSRLLELAVPLCNLETVRLVDGDVQPMHVAVLGVPDEQDTQFDFHPDMLASTGDRARVTALAATVGLPLSALKQWPAWLKAYQRRNGRQ